MQFQDNELLSIFKTTRIVPLLFCLYKIGGSNLLKPHKMLIYTLLTTIKIPTEGEDVSVFNSFIIIAKFVTWNFCYFKLFLALFALDNTN